MLSIKFKGNQPLRGSCDLVWNGESQLLKGSLAKITAFHLFPRATQAGAKNPFSAFFVVQPAFRTQPHRRSTPHTPHHPPPNLALI